MLAIYKCSNKSNKIKLKNKLKIHINIFMDMQSTEFLLTPVLPRGTSNQS